MHSIIQSHLAIVVIVLSLITIFEVVVNFKRPSSLKIILLVILFSIIVHSAGITFYFNYLSYRKLIVIPSAIFMIASLFFVSLLFKNKMSKHLLIFGVTIFIFQSINIFYYLFIFPVSKSLLVSDIPTEGSVQSFFRIFVLIYILSINIKLLFTIIGKHKSRNIYFKELVLPAISIIILVGFICLINILKTFLIIQDPIFQLLYLLSYFLFLLFILFRPKMMNQTDFQFSLIGIFKKPTDREVIFNIFIEVFFTEKYFLNSLATLEDLSQKINVSPDTLNEFLLLNYGIGYTDLVNMHRVDYFIALNKKGDFNQYTIEALAIQSGFGSRQSLQKAFKKFHGGTPSDFISSIKQSNLTPVLPI
jgi:AraC-like DNA-binding protein